MRIALVVSALFVLAGCSSTAVAQHQATPSPSAAASPSPVTTPTQLPVAQSEVIGSMRMTSLSVMWAQTTDRILRSTDAGHAWSDVTPPNPPGTWTGFFALDDRAAWAVHGDFQAPTFTVLRTTDGGRTWSRSITPAPGGAGGQVTFVDRLHGWMLIGLGAAAGSEAVAIEATTDGGASWRQIAQTDDPSSGQGPSGIQFGCDKGELGFGSPTVGLLPTDCAGGPPSAYRTTDGGKHWSAVNIPTLGIPEAGFSLSTPIFLTATDVVLEGSFYSTAPVNGLAVSHDAGATWSVSRLPGSGTIDFESPLSGWQLNDTLSATSDGGRTWRTIATTLPFKGTDMTLQYLGRGIAIAFAMYQVSAYRTDDGGRTWRSVAPRGLTI